jgi:hypothetical protein
MKYNRYDPYRRKYSVTEALKLGLVKPYVKPTPISNNSSWATRYASLPIQTNQVLPSQSSTSGTNQPIPAITNVINTNSTVNPPNTPPPPPRPATPDTSVQTNQPGGEGIYANNVLHKKWKGKEHVGVDTLESLANTDVSNMSQKEYTAHYTKYFSLVDAYRESVDPTKMSEEDFDKHYAKVMSLMDVATKWNEQRKQWLGKHDSESETSSEESSASNEMIAELDKIIAEGPSVNDASTQTSWSENTYIKDLENGIRELIDKNLAMSDLVAAEREQLQHQFNTEKETLHQQTAQDKGKTKQLMNKVLVTAAKLAHASGIDVNSWIRPVGRHWDWNYKAINEDLFQERVDPESGEVLQTGWEAIENVLDRYRYAKATGRVYELPKFSSVSGSSVDILPHRPGFTSVPGPSFDLPRKSTTDVGPNTEPRAPFPLFVRNVPRKRKNSNPLKIFVYPDKKRRVGPSRPPGNPAPPSLIP